MRLATLNPTALKWRKKLLVACKFSHMRVENENELF